MSKPRRGGAFYGCAPNNVGLRAIAVVSGVARPGNGHVGIRVEPLLLVARRAILVARHSEEGKDDYEAKRPTDETQKDPTKTHCLSPLRQPPPPE